MKKDIHIISFSGGKDSTALVLWAKENLFDFQVVFCDTKWEHPITYEYIQYINDTVLDGKLITISSDKYAGFEDMSIKRKRVPSTMARFCTQELKIFPMKKYIQQYKDDEVYMYVGVRADESYKRSRLSKQAFDDYYECTMIRPLIRWTAEQCFDLMKKHGIEPNPLYKMGMKRVGCMPCIMVSKKELKEIIIRFPFVVNNLRELEVKVGSTFFPPGYVPDYACSRVTEDNKYFPTADDVFNYIMAQDNQTELFDEEPEKCMSHYAICE